MRLATINKKRVNKHILEDQNDFWGNVHQLRVNGHLLGESYLFGGQIYHFYGSIITLSNPPENLGMGQTLPPPFWKCQDFGSVCHCKPSPSMLAKLQEDAIAIVVSGVSRN